MRRLSLLLLAVALTGCSPMTRTFDAGRADDLAAVHRRASGAPATVVLVGGFRHPAEAIAVRGDSVSWVDPQTRALRVVPLAELSAISVSARPRLTGEGLAVGTFAGVVLGVLIGKAAPPARGFSPLRVPRGAGQTMIAALFAGLGAGVGVFWAADSQVEDVLLIGVSTVPGSADPATARRGG